MAERLDEFPRSRCGGGPKPYYPYEQWLDGSVWKLSKSDDFTSSPASLNNSIRLYAKNHGIKVRISVDIKANTVTVQALTTEGAE